jgi:FkbM family methyltransferase
MEPIGKYYFSNEVVTIEKHGDYYSISCPLFTYTDGVMSEQGIRWPALGLATFNEKEMIFDDGTVFPRFLSKKLLFIGASEMGEINNYVSDYEKGIFIEALPNVFPYLAHNIELANKKFNRQYIPMNALCTSESGKQYTFNVFSNFGQSSSIYQPNNETWYWDHVNKTGEIELVSQRVEDIVDISSEFDCVIDVQGAELEVLKGFGEKNFALMNHLKIEVSKTPYYKGGVLFDELNLFLNEKGFELEPGQEIPDHGDVFYVKKSKH